jgi:hypothetical protein
MAVKGARMRKLLIGVAAAAMALGATSANANIFRWGSGTPSSAPRTLGPAGEHEDLGDLVYLAAQTMAERAGTLAKDRPIVVSTIVSIDDLDESSTFGRLASQLVANRLAQRGYMVRDLTYMRALTVTPHTGELVLSRDAAKILTDVNAQAVVAGTYAVGGRQIYVSLRLLRADDGQLLSTADVVVPLDHDTEDLVGRPMQWTAHDSEVPHHVMPYTEAVHVGERD